MSFPLVSEHSVIAFLKFLTQCSWRTRYCLWIQGCFRLGLAACTCNSIENKQLPSTFFWLVRRAKAAASTVPCENDCKWQAVYPRQHLEVLVYEAGIENHETHSIFEQKVGEGPTKRWHDHIQMEGWTTIC